MLQHEDNNFTGFVATGNRSTDDKPITIDMLNKSLFACFLYSQPVEDDIATGAYLREYEIENNVKLLNISYMIWHLAATTLKLVPMMGINVYLIGCSGRSLLWHGRNLRETLFVAGLTFRMEMNVHGHSTGPSRSSSLQASGG